MSYSFSSGGSIDSVRNALRNSYAINSRGGRAAITLVNAELDVLEAQGATHCIVFGSGSESGHSIQVNRDATAEREHQEEVAGKLFDDWHNKGVEAGFIQPSLAEGPGIMNVPARSARARRASKDAEKCEDKPNAKA